jgi:hypothetical protein
MQTAMTLLFYNAKVNAFIDDSGINMEGTCIVTISNQKICTKEYIGIFVLGVPVRPSVKSAYKEL